MTFRPLLDWVAATGCSRAAIHLDGAVDVVGFTVAEFIPRQVIHLQQILTAFPLISGTTAGPAS